MAKIRAVDPSRFAFHLPADRSIQPAEQRPGPPERIDGLTAGIVHMTHAPPHGGEMHPDGDELLYVISGRVQVICDSDPAPLPLATGEACIVPKGEWHRLEMLEPTTLLHITPGPGHEHRPVGANSDK
ncbi:MAG: cupin domain-containing protein [Gammaproteobacteria bacterium]|nr:cupin domain-containing protein [Gammaproteobacteria bacterium]